jgi:hypothetical protein
MTYDMDTAIWVGDDEVPISVEAEDGEVTHVRESGGTWETWEAWRGRRSPSTGQVLWLTQMVAERCERWRRERDHEESESV